MPLLSISPNGPRVPCRQLFPRQRDRFGSCSKASHTRCGRCPNYRYLTHNTYIIGQSHKKYKKIPLFSAKIEKNRKKHPDFLTQSTVQKQIIRQPRKWEDKGRGSGPAPPAGRAAADKKEGERTVSVLSPRFLLSRYFRISAPTSLRPSRAWAMALSHSSTVRVRSAARRMRA